MFKIQWHYPWVRSKICKIPQQLAEAGSRIPRIQQNLLCPNPGPRGSHGNVAVTGSKISKIPWENENIRFKILQDPRSWILRIQDPGSFCGLGTCLMAGSVLSVVDATDQQSSLTEYFQNLKHSFKGKWYVRSKTKRNKIRKIFPLTKLFFLISTLMEIWRKDLQSYAIKN